MGPTLSAFNTTDGVFPDTVISSYFPLKTGISSDRVNLFLSKLRCSAALTPVGCTVSDFIRVVVFARVPTKIIKPVVLRVSIIMAAFKALWPFAYKCLQNHCMWAHRLLTVVSPQHEKWTLIGRVDWLRLYFSRLYRSDSPKVRNLVKTFKSDYCAPKFHTHNMGISQCGYGVNP